MKKSNVLLWFILILFAGVAFWALSTDKLDSMAGLFINGFWNSLEGMVRPIFRK